MKTTSAHTLSELTLAAAHAAAKATTAQAWYAPAQAKFRADLAIRIATGEGTGSPERHGALAYAQIGTSHGLRRAYKLISRAEGMSALGRQGMARSIANGDCDLFREWGRHA